MCYNCELYKIQINKLESDKNRIIQQRDTLFQKNAEIHKLNMAHLLEKIKLLEDRNQLLVEKNQFLTEKIQTYSANVDK